MFGIIADLISSVLTILFPIYASYKALRTRDPSIILPWLMYWVVIATFGLIESWTYWIISWTPFYSWIRLAFLSYLVLPHTQGARVIYQAYLDPWLYAHEDQIETAIVKGHAYARDLGVQYMEQAIDFIRAKLGLPQIDRVRPIPQSTTSTSPQASSAGALASALLARFNMPATGAGQGAGQGAASSAGSSTGGDLFSQFTSGLSDLASRVSSAAGGSPQNVMPANMRNASPEEQQQYLREQKEKLANLLRAYDTASDDLSSARTVNTEKPDGMWQRRRRSSGQSSSQNYAQNHAQGSGAHYN